MAYKNEKQIISGKDSEKLLKKQNIVNYEELMDKLKKDEFISIWKNNYKINMESGFLSNERTRPISFLTNTQTITNIPVVLIVAGPSIDKNLHYLKNYQDNCIIICADVVLFKLIEHNIKPDFVVNIDPSDSIVRFWDFLDTSDLTLVCPTTSSPKVYETWKGNFFIYNQTDIKNLPKNEVLKKINKINKNWGSFYNRLFVGATMTQLAELLKPSSIILIGYDFAFSDEKAYCDGFLDIKIYHLEDPVGSDAHTKMINKLKSDEIKKEVEIYVSKDQPSVWTSNTLNLYKKTYAEYAKKLPYKIINSTEGGILTEFEKMPLKNSLEKYCNSPLKTKNFNIIPKRKRNRKKR